VREVAGETGGNDAAKLIVALATVSKTKELLRL